MGQNNISGATGSFQTDDRRPGRLTRSSAQHLLSVLVKSGTKAPNSDPKASQISTDTQPSQGGTEDWATDNESIDLEAQVEVTDTAWAAEEVVDSAPTWADRVASQEQQLLG